MATKKPQPRLKVWLDDPICGPLQQIGTLHKIGHGGVRFAYATAWLKNPLAFKLDPALTLDAKDFFSLVLVSLNEDGIKEFDDV